MNWVMIVLFLHIGEGNIASTSAQFESQALCEAAAAKVKSELGGAFTNVYISCVQAKAEAPRP